MDIFFKQSILYFSFQLFLFTCHFESTAFDTLSSISLHAKCGIILWIFAVVLSSQNNVIFSSESETAHFTFLPIFSLDCVLPSSLVQEKNSSYS